MGLSIEIFIEENYFHLQNILENALWISSSENFEERTNWASFKKRAPKEKL